MISNGRLFRHQNEFHVLWCDNLQWRDGLNGMSLPSTPCLFMFLEQHVQWRYEWDVSSVTSMGDMSLRSDNVQWRYFQWDVSKVISHEWYVHSNSVQCRYFQMDVFPSPYMEVCLMERQCSMAIFEWNVSSVTQHGLNVLRSDSVQWRYFQMGRLFRHPMGYVQRSDSVQWRYPNGMSLPSPHGDMFNATAFNGIPNGTSLLSPIWGMFTERQRSMAISEWTSLRHRYERYVLSNGVQWRYFRMGRLFRHPACMFHDATAFNGDISEWDVSSVTSWMVCS
jgi:surface protein